MYLDLKELPVFKACAFRRFNEGEYHVNRICSDSVLLMIIEGVLRFYEDGVPVELTAGEWYIQPAGLLQEGRIPSSSPYYFYIHFHGTFHKEMSKNRDEVLPVRGILSTDTLFSLFQKMTSLENSPLSGILEKQSVFYQILSSLNPMNVGKHNTTVTEIADYLADNCGIKLVLSDVANKYSYSQDHIIRLFRQHFRITPHQYLTMVRINRAQQLLVSSNRTVSQIAEDCGYDDISVFMRAFRKRNGMTPAKWRKSIVLRS